MSAIPDRDKTAASRRSQRTLYYRLDENRQVIPVDISMAEADAAQKIVAWATARSDAGRVVRCDHIDGTLVSTVFLGIDHSIWGDGPPEVFETMVFAPRRRWLFQRYATWAEALEGHVLAVREVKGGG